MIYYSTGLGIHLPPLKKKVECNEKTGSLLVKEGYLVTDLSELSDEVKKEPIQVEEKEVAINTNTHLNDGSKVEVIQPKRKGNPNWGKK